MLPTVTATFLVGINIVQVAAISEFGRFSQGETATLTCVGYGRPTADITWVRDGQTISNSSLISISEQELIQNGLLFKQSFLQLCSVRISDAGMYTCVVSDGRTSVNASTRFSIVGKKLCKHFSLK